MHDFMSFLVLQSSLRGRDRVGCFALMSFGCLVTVNVNVLTVAFLHGAVGWSAVVLPPYIKFGPHREKTCLRVSDKVRFKLVCLATETS